jgi:cytochrome c oxidase assembly protein subunit 15
MDLTDPNPITAFQIVLHMMHRLGALATLLAVGACAWLSRSQFGSRAALSHASLAWFGLVLFQAVLGAATVLSRKAADVATLHVLAGAASLVVGGLLCFTMLRFALARRKAEKAHSHSSAGNLRAPHTQTALTAG